MYMHMYYIVLLLFSQMGMSKSYFSQKWNCGKLCVVAPRAFSCMYHSGLSSQQDCELPIYKYITEIC